MVRKEDQRAFGSVDDTSISRFRRQLVREQDHLTTDMPFDRLTRHVVRPLVRQQDHVGIGAQQ
jgi:hypothetical protein